MRPRTVTEITNAETACREWCDWTDEDEVQHVPGCAMEPPEDWRDFTDYDDREIDEAMEREVCE